MTEIKVIAGGLLSAGAIMDIRSKKIHLGILLPAAALGAVWLLACKELSFYGSIGGAAVGLGVLAVSYATRGKIGSGDGIMLGIAGVFLGFWNTLSLFMTAAFLAAGAGVFMMAVKKCGRNYEMPFIPFLWAAFMGGWLLWN